MLNGKEVTLKKDVNNVEELLETVTNLTPVEEELDGTTKLDVMETMKQVAVKIEKLIEKRKVSSVMDRNRSTFFSTKKSYKRLNETASEMILNLTARTNNQTLNYLSSRYQSTPFKTSQQNETLGIIYNLSTCNDTSMIDYCSTPKTNNPCISPPDVEEEINTIITRSNRGTIWNCIETILEELKTDFVQTFISGNMGLQ